MHSVFYSDVVLKCFIFHGRREDPVATKANPTDDPHKFAVAIATHPTDPHEFALGLTDGAIVVLNPPHSDAEPQQSATPEPHDDAEPPQSDTTVVLNPRHSIRRKIF